MDEHKETQKSPDDAASKKKSEARFEEVLMREAYEHMGKGDYTAAAGVFQDILRRFGVSLDDTQKSLIHSELGTLCYWLGDYDAAKHHSENSLGYGDKNDRAYEILGKICVAQFKFPEARGFFSRIDPKNCARTLGLCLVAIKLREKRAAESYLREAAALVPSTYPEYRLYAAYIQLLRGDSAGAVHTTRELRPKFENDPAALLLIAEIFMTAGNYGEASALAKHVGVRCPENDHVYAISAHASYADDDTQGAERNANEAVRLNPRNAYAKTILMKLATRKGIYSTAEKIGQQIISDSPEYSLAHANLGDVYFNEGRYELAGVEYEQTQELMDSNTKGAQLRQARMKFVAGNYKNAADMLAKLIESHHTYYDDAMCDLALCYDSLGDEEQRDSVIEKMEMRRSMYHRTEKLLQFFSA